MNRTRIEWTEYSWNPLRGCTRVSDGCRNCYAERIAARFSGDIDLGNGRSMANSCRKPLPFDNTAIMTASGPRWTGNVQLIESKLTEPFRRRKPATIFVNSMSDTFHEKIPDEWLDRMFAVMALCPQHKFLVLTKRVKRMREWFTPNRWERVRLIAKFFVGMQPEWDWPLPNVILGVSCENQATADERIPNLLATPAAMRFVSLEPLLGAVDVSRYLACPRGGPETCGNQGPTCCQCDPRRQSNAGLDWVIVGGESGLGARPMVPEWPRAIRDQCIAAGVPYFHKQNGEWSTVPTETVTNRTKYEDVPVGDGTHHRMFPVGKRAAGRLLDGRTWDQRPKGWG